MRRISTEDNGEAFERRRDASEDNLYLGPSHNALVTPLNQLDVTLT